MPSLLHSSLDLLFYSGTSHTFRNMLRGIGAIFMLHHIRPDGSRKRGFNPNKGLEITPEFLDGVIGHVNRRGYQLMSLEQAVGRLRNPPAEKTPFAVFTIDDGYRDNLEHAWPVFRKHKCPFTIFVAPAISDGHCEIWWRGLELVIAAEKHIRTTIEGTSFDLTAVSDEEKQVAFETLYWPLRKMPERRQRAWIRDFCASRGVDLDAYCQAEAMSWADLRRIAADPLCTIGSHTVNHYALAKLPPAEARHESIESRDRIAKELGQRPKFFAYPYGDETSAAARDFSLIAEAGFEAAVTTRKGVIFPEHKHHLTALPRVSLNGNFQKLRYVDVLMSGAAFALLNGFRRVNAA
jgi:peptidoglycan/xylan/chitin deacetylase (PgdA/CDA1 family)